MINYKYINKSTDIKLNLKTISELWKQNWEYKNELDWILIFCKKVVSKQDKEKKQETKSPEFIEFAKLYPKKTDLSSDNLIQKYNKLALEWKHTVILEWLKRYINYIEVEKTAPKFIKNAYTWINANSWENEYKILENRFWYNKKFISEMLNWMNSKQVEYIMWKIKEREKKNNKEMTEWVLQNIINPN